LDTPRKDEHRSDTLTFPSTTIDNISTFSVEYLNQRAFKEYQSKVGFQAKALMTAVDEYILQGGVGTPVEQDAATGDERSTVSKQ
jgi:hypothetical protein